MVLAPLAGRVLESESLVLVEWLEAPASAAVVAERGTVHTYWNPRPEPARYLLAMTPRIHALIAALHAAGTDPDAVFRKHASTLIGWP